MTDPTNLNTDRSAVALSSPEVTRDDYVELGGSAELDEMFIRGAMSEFTTGVTIIVTEDEGETCGFACQSFPSLSLIPLMVLLMVMRTLRSWLHIWNVGHFLVNVSAEDQEDISAAFGRSNGEKFKMGKWTRSGLGNPLLHGCSVWVDCTVVDVYEDGDHRIVTTDIAAIGRREEINPLTYHRGPYVRVFHPDTDASIDRKWRQRPSV